MEINLVQALIDTLNCIEVHGEDNLSRLLGCINLLKSVVNQTESNEGGEEIDG